MTRRTRGREIALQVLYQSEQNSGFSTPEARRFIKRRLRSDPKLIEFTETLIDGVQQHQENLDEMISEVAENWRIDRMAAIDRNILRLGAYEMLYSEEVPSKVAINEALELAKRYSTAQSSRFVNGILDRLQAQSQSQSETQASPATSEDAATDPSEILVAGGSEASLADASETALVETSSDDAIAEATEAPVESSESAEASTETVASEPDTESQLEAESARESEPESESDPEPKPSEPDQKAEPAS